MELRWTKSALYDLENIRNYIANDSEFYAFRLTEKIFQAVEKLKFFPESGRIVPVVAIKNIREIILMNYRIIYKPEEDFIYILAIVHSARDFKNIKLEP
ncbi:MAG: type II toxin-antitoxin system RelE/ParE family toxin [Bacillota bacterium]|jgi:addiction module RelE/StbE family toxin